MKTFIIDEEIVFIPAEKKLSSLRNNKTVIMFSTGTRCLEYLLAKQGVVVSQKELIPVCWEGENSLKTVTQATYYQCLTDLRRNFKELGYSKPLISTVRGQGVKINADININLTEEDEKSHPETRSETTKPPIRYIFKKSYKLWIAVMLVITICIVALFIIIRNTPPENNMQENYHTVDGYPGCYFFNNENVSNDFAKDFLHKKNFNCEEGKNYYISYFSAAPRLTIFSCSNSEPLTCESFTFLGHSL